jgi:hypothetical protein
MDIWAQNAKLRCFRVHSILVIREPTIATLSGRTERMTNQPIGQCGAVSASASDGHPERQSGPAINRLGIGLIVFSGILWFSLFAIPFLPLSTAQKATVGGVVFVTVQFSWWSGAAFVGPRAMKSFGGWFRGLRSRSPD